MAKKSYKYKPVTTNTDDNSMERSITYFNKNVTNFSSSTDKLVKSIDTFTKSVDAFKKSTEEDKKTKEKDKKDRDKDKKSGGGAPDAPASKNQAWAKKTQKGLDKFQTQASKLGIERLQKFTGDVFGKRATQTMTKGMAKFAGSIGPKGGGGFGAGMMGKAMGGLGSFAGGLLRFAGPIGAIAGIAKMAFDFWDSGGVAKLKVGAKMLTGNKMMGKDDIANVQKDLEGTEQMRKLNAEYNYKVPMQLRQQAADDMLNYNKSIEQDKLSYDQSLVKDKLEYEMGKRKDAVQFQFQQAMETLDAEMSKRKDIQASGMSFINQYSTISERALKAIGSSTKMIVEGISKFQQIFGGSVKESFQLSENAQGLAYHFGVGADDVQNMTNLFRLMGKTTAKTAQNLINGITKFADANLLAPQAIFNQIKDAGEDIYKFSSGTAENFVKQAGLLTKMGASMSQMMKASDSMVLNYKDSIKAEMSLSAMLGKNVNLSEVRARLMSGDQAGAASALKTQLGGMDIGAMNPFQKQALTQATGMDISALMGLQSGKGGGLSGELKAEETKGKIFADGALKQDIANAGAKMKLEQEQRGKMLAFEQRQRLIMLTLEQAQRLDGIFLEQKYRAIYAEKGYKDAKEAMAVDMIAEQAANFGSNLISGTASSLNSAGLKDAAMIQKYTDSIAAVDNSLTNLISSGAIKGTDMRLADYLTKKDDILAKAGKETPAKIKEALEIAYNDIFAQEAEQLKKAEVVQAKQNERLVNIAKAMADINRLKGGGDTFETFVKKYKVSQEERVAARQLLNGNTLGSRLKTDVTTTGKANVTNPTVVNKAVVDAVVTNANKQIVTATRAIDVQTKELTDSQYGIALQKEMVAILGLSSQFLQQISDTLTNHKDININGKVLAQSLLNQARRNYAIARNG